VHLHGVRGFQEHLSLAVLPETQVSEWIRLFAEVSFSGVVNLEVFSPADLDASMVMLIQACNTLPKDGVNSFKGYE